MASSSNGTSASSSMARGRRIALLVTDGFEQAELTGPRDALEGAGFDAQIVAPKPGQVQGFNHVDKADRFDVDQTLDQASPDAFDAVVLPGGVVNADELRTDEKARAFVQAIDRAGKPVAVICHGAWLLIDAGLVKGQNPDQLAEPRDRPAQRRRPMGGPARPGRGPLDQQPQARRHPAVQRTDPEDAPAGRRHGTRSPQLTRRDAPW